MIIRLPLRFEGSKGEKVLYALFDSGATYSCINDEVVEELEQLTALHTPMRMVSVEDKINPAKLNSYFSFPRVAKSANSELFKDFCDEAETEKNSQIVGFILSSSLPASASTFMEIKYRVTLDFYHEDIRLSDEFYVIPDLSEQAIIGASTMQKWRIKLDFEHDNVILDPAVAKAILVNLIAK